MLINLRNALMAGKRLPYDAEVEYLQSSGTQWINTGVTPTPSDSMRIVADLSLTSINTGDNNIVFGSYIETPTVRQFAFVDRSAKARVAYVGAASGTVTVSAGTDYLFEAQFAAGNSYLNVNGATSSQNTSTAATLPTQPMALFACRYNDSVISPSSMRLRSCKIYLNGILVRDFIPVRKGTVGYLYDRVSGKLFGNAGSGDFVLGSDVVPVEWLQSSGAQWIDSGTYMAYGDEFDMDFIVDSLNSANNYTGGYVLGASTGGKRSYTLGWYGTSSWRRFLFCFEDDSSSYQTFPTVSAHKRYSIQCHAESGNMRMTVNGTTYTDNASNAANNNLLAMFARATSQSNGVITAVNAQSNLTLYKLDQYRGGIALHKWRPIRVGTDATSWEGAMMDTLTRRIYRNAGTGAFSYGNDLKYPIPAE